jgi:hypothetical protein
MVPRASDGATVTPRPVSSTRIDPPSTSIDLASIDVEPGMTRIVQTTISVVPAMRLIVPGTTGVTPGSIHVDRRSILVDVGHVEPGF